MTETHTPLPCPFCAGEAEVHEGSDPRYPWSVKSFHEEGCFLMYSNVNRHRYYATEAEALTVWNTRAVNSHHDLIEALEALLNSSGARGVYHASKHFDAVEAAENLLAALKEPTR